LKREKRKPNPKKQEKTAPLGLPFRHEKRGKGEISANFKNEIKKIAPGKRRKCQPVGKNGKTGRSGRRYGKTGTITLKKGACTKGGKPRAGQDWGEKSGWWKRRLGITLASRKKL